MAISKIGRNATDTSISDSGDATAITISSAELVTVASGLTLTDGDVTVASGHGVSFAATGDGSGTDSSELLDDYEEGTWTAGSAVGGFNAESGSVIYTKIGNVVHFHVEGSFTNSSNAENVEITGLPYTPSINQVAGSAMWQDLDTNFQGGVVYARSSGKLGFFDDGTTSTSTNVLKHNEIGSSNAVILSGTYFT